ncbi:PDR/VanB family oxidoreductase [Microbacterium fluvii]|uniref:PDR/VanB family oxidoreductase n=1 Tax=Microbacterium fluvii TaxID=415215 RepID=A0ABW2HDE3_9MICO|nr:PDR/VanB family oxidoreductase [Microbacterium fluvii]MCU4672763.1 PDR/VanB family oxidoreductase [Microbacterium fluvii]
MMPLVVRELRRETPSIVSIRLEDAQGAPLPRWEAGSHLDIQLITRQERQYSLCGDPDDERGYRIAVKLEPLSRGGSHYIHRFLRVGSTVWARPPRNHFALQDAPSYLLLAVGIGITPILSMARHLEAAGADWRMLYLARTEDDVAFRSEIDALGSRARVHLSAVDGRIDLDELTAGLAEGTEVYTCGPQGFIDALIELRDRRPELSINLERFEPIAREYRPDEEFEVYCSGSDLVVTVPADRSMLQALQGAGVAVSGSCLRGICGSCALQVLDGMPEHRDSLNTDDSSTTVYPCVSRSLSPRLTVDA